MSAETTSIHQEPEFQRKKRAYFQDFMLCRLPQAREFRKYGLLNEEGSEGWRNVARHQLLSAVMTETVLELLGIQNESLISKSLTHDVDKRRQQESQSKREIWADELGKSERPLVATGTNFTGFSSWGMDEYILRYVDSSIGENPNQQTVGELFGARDPNKLSEVMILPWRQRIQMFKDNKAEEGEKGIPLYGMTTWDKLEEIMTTIEGDLYRRIIEKNPDLAERYTSPDQLTDLIEDRIHEKILNS